MLLSEKYRPPSLREAGNIGVLAEVVQSFSTETFPSMIIAGAGGSGKRTVLMAFLRHLYKRKIEFFARTKEVAVSTSKTVEVTLLEAQECMELRTASLGYSDKKVIQEVIKDFSSTQSIRGFGGGGEERHFTKTLIIPDAEFLSKGAQMALRRTMEKYAGNFRIILVCQTTSPLIEAIRSRFFVCRVPCYRDEQILDICRGICEKEQKFGVSNEFLRDIVLASHGNLRRVLVLLEMHLLNGDKKAASLDWEGTVDKVVRLALSSPSVQTLFSIRDLFYELLTHGVRGRDILVHLVRRVIAVVPDAICAEVAHTAALYDARLRSGTKDIFHLEGFIASVMVLCENKR